MERLFSYGAALARFIAEEQAQAEAQQRANAPAQAQAAYLAGRRVASPLPEAPFLSKTDGLLAGLLYGGQAMEGAEGFETINITGSGTVGLTPPAGALLAVVVAELVSGTAADQTRLLRFTQSGTAPTTDAGFPLGHLGQLQVSGKSHLARVRFISLYPSATVRLHVEYRY